MFVVLKGALKVASNTPNYHCHIYTYIWLGGVLSNMLEINEN
jgi:hypothetical protein